MKLLPFFLLYYVSLSSVEAQNVIYVNQNASGGQTGESWTDAYQNLQDALLAALSINEIWVAAGTYKPTSGTDRTASFYLPSGVRLYGGFVGTETERA